MADLHVHQERSPRLDRVLSRRAGQEPFDWPTWMGRMTSFVAPGVPRLRRMQAHLPAPLSDDDPEVFICRIGDLLGEAAESGALLVEPRFGNDTVLRPDFLVHFWEAARRVRAQHPHLCVAPLVNVQAWRPEEELARVMEVCLRGAATGELAGIDLLSEPYDTEAEWGGAYRFAARAAAAGLGVAVHAGEFTTANLAPALGVPGVTRIGHATQAVGDPRLLDSLVASGVTVECCLTSNVVLGAVADLSDHPLPRFVELGVPVALGTDDPVQLSTTIADEYRRAAALGLRTAELRAITRTAVASSFAPPEERARLLACLRPGP